MTKLLFLFSAFTAMSSSAFAMDQDNPNPRRIAIGYGRIPEEVINYRKSTTLDLQVELQKRTVGYQNRLARMTRAHSEWILLKFENKDNHKIIEEYYNNLLPVQKYYLSDQAIGQHFKDLDATIEIERELVSRGALLQ
jgi:hypothetical protein